MKKIIKIKIITTILVFGYTIGLLCVGTFTANHLTSTICDGFVVIAYCITGIIGIFSFEYILSSIIDNVKKEERNERNNV